MRIAPHPMALAPVLALGLLFSSAVLAVPATGKSEVAPVEVQPKGLLAVTPIFGEVFAQRLPQAFKPQAETTQGQMYMRAMVLATDPDQGPWTQRVLLTAIKDGASLPNASAKTYALFIAKGFKDACPTTFTGGEMSQGRTETGHETYVMAVACGSHSLTSDKKPTSEITVVATFKGDKNMYSLQWGSRAAPMNREPVLDQALLQKRLAEMTPVRICRLVEGEQAPFPSCVGKLGGKAASKPR
ncbi:MAG: hypothetical protein J7598_23925 [Mitsuaria chitosanitabida]|uniref:hypothetical protein n=1 Tax=Roseateles chitosanitabidus TaxID=65048 RepID=UPI001B1EC6AA|nr:hypothetical protein [Roseateles chitosanitabidus]MBO9689661.1 hypothetical protein [Roseateles chitosanitabidus]